MTEQQRQTEYFKLSELKQQLENDRRALNARRTGYEEHIHYVQQSLAKLERWDTGAREFPDLRHWPSADDIKELFDDCADNEKRLRKANHRLKNFQF